jgi:DNA (cytosine-5)-methyltransferase 1
MKRDKPTLLDLFCGGGGCAKGYQRAGFRVFGVDHKPQPRYCGDGFVQSDAIEYLRRLIESGEVEQFDAIHASPPCQVYAATRFLSGDHPDLIAPIRELLRQAGKPYVIENVPGAPLVNPVKLNGLLFDLNVERERWFECAGFEVPFVLLPQAARRSVKMGRPVKDGDLIHVVGHFSGVAVAQRAMGIDWLGQKELAQAIPPAYTEFIGRQLMTALLEQYELC